MVLFSRMRLWMVVAGLVALARGAVALAVPADGAAVAPPAAGALPTLRITVFAPPSYSTWLPAIIKKNHLDILHGFRLEVTPKVGQVAYVDFAHGVDKVCFCVAPQTFTQFVEQGADISMVFNVFKFTNLVAVSDPSIRTVADLRGKTLGAATGTGNWSVTSFLLKQSGLDLSTVKIHSTESATEVAEFAMGRLDAIFPAPVEIASVQTQTSRYHVISIFDQAKWQAYSHSPGIPSIALGAWRDWLAVPANLDLVKRLYAATQDAADFARAHPDDAATIVSDSTKMDRAAVTYVLAHYPEILDVRPIGAYKGAIKVLSQQLMVTDDVLERPLTDAEIDRYVANFQP
ncbi:ABC transporter substrate-binding protein [Caballeronia sp. LjRoot31]|uniref:ABC transporter substrate-binding protein n=1 Tax=Caballeronia sp. LjRoot31 TaxID=3342324 RepID=UPI003ECCD8E1